MNKENFKFWILGWLILLGVLTLLSVILLINLWHDFDDLKEYEALKADMAEFNSYCLSPFSIEGNVLTMSESYCVSRFVEIFREAH